MRTRDYTLSEQEQAQLEQIIRTDKRQKVVQRATAIRMLGLGQTTSQVSEALLVTTACVRNWFNRWRQQSIAGLANQAKAGRPRQATEAYWQVIDQALQSDPASLGYAFTIWTVERLRDHAERATGKRLNANYLAEQMKRRGYVYRRPKLDLAHQQDAQAREQAAAALEALKKTPKQGILHFSLWTKQP
jgi:transposase